MPRNPALAKQAWESELERLQLVDGRGRWSWFRGESGLLTYLAEPVGGLSDVAVRDADFDVLVVADCVRGHVLDFCARREWCKSMRQQPLLTVNARGVVARDAAA